MKYDTAGNEIDELIENCDCGLTGGCGSCGLKESKIGFDESFKKKSFKEIIAEQKEKKK